MRNASPPAAGRAQGAFIERWLTLGEASRALGVTPGTLRRWADGGQIPSFTTPGGHRRFPAAAIQSFIPSRRARRPALATIGGSADRMARAYSRARPLAARPEPAGWFAGLSQAQRIGFRRRGNELVGHLLAYLDAERDRRAALLSDAEKVAEEYGAEAASCGASLIDSVEGFLHFRRPFIEQLALIARRRRLDTRETTGLLSDAESALDHTLVALMFGHKRALERP